MTYGIIIPNSTDQSSITSNPLAFIAAHKPDVFPFCSIFSKNTLV